ncbi:succinate--CoA ligase subunit alpha [Oscillatoria salina]|uniref:succinate--CoA ligase subunit alpha n=1 Tax=Oscillatoria salina TaxID=331517 RepID=UPI0013B649D8|nr:CoA-binding protein [Oscillatoria salina]MBZ8183011.1 CoA-binding protein [Oscillatoria salina IIICB1]NET86628.1 CoA-binding protein [Kamptonema sp. SIO1D9]
MNWTPDSKILVQGITEPIGVHYTLKMKDYGTNIVAGVSAGQGGTKLSDIPIFDLVEEARSALGEIDFSLIFVPSYAALDAVSEAIAAGIRQIILATAGVPPLDMVRLLKKVRETDTLLLGPGNAGIIIPEKFFLGISEPQFFTPGKVGIISRTDSLIYEVALELTQAKLGQSIAVSLGSEGIIASDFQHWLGILAQDKTTQAIVLLGQAIASQEKATVEYIKSAIAKPVVVYLAGTHTPVNLPLGDSAAIIATQLTQTPEGSRISDRQLSTFEKAKIPLAKRPSQIPSLVKKLLKKK